MFTNKQTKTLSIRSTFDHIHDQAISIGFANDKRKMLKAHVIWFGQPMGFKIETAVFHAALSELLEDPQDPNINQTVPESSFESIHPPCVLQSRLLVDLSAYVYQLHGLGGH